MSINFKLVVFFIFVLLVQNGVAGSTYVSPSFYFTYGDYSNKNVSTSFVFYNTLQLTEKFFLVNSYDNLTITAPNSAGWSYKQQMLSGGVFANFFPFYYKFTYAHLKGDFKLKGYSGADYSDYSNLYNLDFVYYKNLFYYGFSYSYINSHGVLTADSLEKQSAHQLSLKLEYIIHPKVFLSLKPNFSKIEDGRNLYSVAYKIHYLPLPELLFKVGGFIGERAYFFDPDLLIIFNQNETQKLQVFGTVEYFPSYLLKLAVSFQHSEFAGYSIDYYTAGVKLNLNF